MRSLVATHDCPLAASSLSRPLDRPLVYFRCVTGYLPVVDAELLAYTPVAFP
jgi:hypothetical protein